MTLLLLQLELLSKGMCRKNSHFPDATNQFILQLFDCRQMQQAYNYEALQRLHSTKLFQEGSSLMISVNRNSNSGNWERLTASP